LISAEEQYLVANDGTSDRPAELVSLEAVIGEIECIARIHRPIPQKLEGGAVKLVGAGFRNGVHGA
jgi:hypothetical protein